jgi:hypothetical protein
MEYAARQDYYLTWLWCTPIAGVFDETGNWLPFGSTWIHYPPTVVAWIHYPPTVVAWIHYTPTVVEWIHYPPTVVACIHYPPTVIAWIHYPLTVVACTAYFSSCPCCCFFCAICFHILCLMLYIFLDCPDCPCGFGQHLFHNKRLHNSKRNN